MFSGLTIECTQAELDLVLTGDRTDAWAVAMHRQVAGSIAAGRVVLAVVVGAPGPRVIVHAAAAAAAAAALGQQGPQGGLVAIELGGTMVPGQTWMRNRDTGEAVLITETGREITRYQNSDIDGEVQTTRLHQLFEVLDGVPADGEPD